ncbi:amino acid adenylation domain-containing protein [Actinomadura sp. 9N215]|uniref:amino acid adenylation domain-containing protein n=1 Tax=Actinomadura sp. 9N215 TaxID=3375150 RepID=UPI0037A4A194
MLHRLLSEAAAGHPGKAALVDGDRVLTYAELDRAVNRLARVLREAGVGRGDRVAILLDKSAEAIVSIYGVLAAGAAYVPLDPQAPPARRRRIITDCSPRLLLCRDPDDAETLREEPAGTPRGEPAGNTRVLSVAEVCAGEAATSSASAESVSADHVRAKAGGDDLAYILYTSGSTGVPKGAAFTHRNGLAFVRWAAEEFAVTGADRVASFAPLHFDLSVFDVFASAAAAATLVLVPRRVSVFPAELASFVRSREITVWYSTPSALTLLLRHGRPVPRDLAGLRVILFAGEVFPAPRLAELADLAPHARLANLYGPTETNVCTWTQVRRPIDPGTPVPIGRPVPGVSTTVIGDDGTPVRAGEVGELYVRGPTVMRGYWNDPDRTERALVRLPGAQGVFYATGDLVRVDGDGVHHFHGRRDDQVKSAGHRIELGEVEIVLHGHPSVAECAVLAVPDPDITNRIVGSVVAPGVSAAELARHCARRLPPYMVPHRFELLDSLPKTSTGKTDRRALRDLAAAAEPR